MLVNFKLFNEVNQHLIQNNLDSTISLVCHSLKENC
jgi:hypothetical protein